MIKYLMSLRYYERGLIGIGACIIFFILGYFFLNYISKMETFPLGDTIYILMGSIICGLSILGVFLNIRYMYVMKNKNKKRRRRRVNRLPK